MTKRAFLVQLMKGDEVENEEVRYARWPKDAAENAATSIIPWGHAYRKLRVRSLVDGVHPESGSLPCRDYYITLKRSIARVDVYK